jgi:hypothetical protein
MMLPAIRKIAHPDSQGLIQIEVPATFGSAVEVIILPLGEQASFQVPDANPSSALAAIENSAFVREVIASPMEDCWNDL